MKDPAKSSAAWQQEFLERIAQPCTLLELFDVIPGVSMYIKDRQSRWVHANRTVCDVVGAKNPADLIGRTDVDFFPPALAAQYVAEDQRVVLSGQPLADQVWMVPGKNGIPRLYLCTKIPLRDRRNHVIGLAGLNRPYEFSANDSAGYSRLMSVITFVTEHYARNIEVTDMAEHVFLSVSQLQREFARSFGITPIRYLREVRVGVVRHLLESSDQSLSTIAANCGFFDQSHMTKHFKASTGLTPLKYRQRFRST